MTNINNNKEARIASIRWEVTNLILDGTSKDEILNCVLSQFAVMDCVEG